MSKFYVCKLCGELTTDQELNDRCSQGCMPYCDCQYMQLSWDANTKTFEPVFLQYYEQYHEIPENIYNELLKESNTVKRLWMLATISEDELTSQK